MRPLTISLLTVAITLSTGGAASARTFAPMCVEPLQPCLPTDEDDLRLVPRPEFVDACAYVRCSIKQ